MKEKKGPIVNKHLRKSWDFLERATQKQNSSARKLLGRRISSNDHEIKNCNATTQRDDFLNCHEIKNCRLVPNLLKFAVIIPFLAIELRATPNGNPASRFWVLRGKNIALSILCNATLLVGLYYLLPFIL